ncbi:MAG: hypothetical protein L6V93_13910 [Clostridiales bacterium]|nr:MAG: hypothetical protein L6V93_13910 [Clostridiales bacterium]
MYLDDEGWSEKGLEGYKKERREEGFIPEDEIPAEDWVTLYSADGRTMKTVYFLVDTYKKTLDGRLQKPVTMYASDGRTISVLESEVEDYKKVGWFVYSEVTMYSLDGRSVSVPISEVNEYKRVGWYETKVTPVTMYAPDGRTLSVANTEVDDYKKVGWYEVPVQTLYAPDGRSSVFLQKQRLMHSFQWGGTPSRL